MFIVRFAIYLPATLAIHKLACVEVLLNHVLFGLNAVQCHFPSVVLCSSFESKSGAGCSCCLVSVAGEWFVNRVGFVVRCLFSASG